ncbi:MAG TPA: ribosome silencing factor [Ignavibacteria bacterium]|nr:ribosome silencing factor [Ignavibacteria bacterium]HMQ99706.1 ribosome silencing factor [Ignavibacteria bacterium]
MDSKTLAFKLAELALTKKADDIRILDLRKITTIADFFVICTAHSEPQVKAVADAVLEGAKKDGETVWHKEGTNMRSWVLLDFVDVVVHIFLKDTRSFYSLEKLWGDAEITEITDEAPKGKVMTNAAKPKAVKKPAVKKSAAKKKPAPKNPAAKKPVAKRKPASKK